MKQSHCDSICQPYFMWRRWFNLSFEFRSGITVTERNKRRFGRATLSGLWIALLLMEEFYSPVGEAIFPFLCSVFHRSRKNWQQKRNCEPAIKSSELCYSKPDKYKVNQAVVQMHCLSYCYSANFTNHGNKCLKLLLHSILALFSRNTGLCNKSCKKIAQTLDKRSLQNY